MIDTETLTYKNSSSSKNILILEKEPHLCMKNSGVFKKYGYTFDRLSSEEEALNALKTTSYDLIVLDIDCESIEFDALKTAEIILSEHELPIIFISEAPQEEILNKIENVTSFGFIEKSSGETAILASIKIALQLFESKMKGKRSKKELIENKVIFDLVENHPSVAIVKLDSRLNIEYVSPSMENMLGFPVANIYGTSVLRNVHPDDIEHLEQTVANAIAHYDQLYDGLFRIYTPKGKIRWVECKARFLYDAWNNFNGAIFIQSDITDRKQAEILLKESENKYRSLFENMQDGIASVDLNGRILTYNNAFKQMLGYTDEELKTLTTDDITPSKWHSMERGILRNQVEKMGYSSIYEKECQDKNGRIIPVSLRTYLLKDENGNHIGYSALFRDLTNQKQLEKELLDRQKKLEQLLNEKEYLMNEMNHRIKNNLMMVRSLITLKNITLGETADISDLENQIIAISRLHDMLSKTENSEKILFKEYIENVLSNIFDSFTGSQVEVIYEIEDIEFTIKDTVNLGLIINEIATNAIKHGYSGQTDSVFKISLKKIDNENLYKLCLSNNGRSFPDSVSLNSSDSMGLRLIQELVSSLDGETELIKQPYPEFIFTFPVH